MPACKLYEALSGKICQEQYIEIGSQSLLEIAYVWDDLKTIFKEKPCPLNSTI